MSKPTAPVLVSIDGKRVEITTDAQASAFLSRFGLANAADIFTAAGRFASDFRSALAMLRFVARHSRTALVVA
jgi:hypothetical protein